MQPVAPWKRYTLLSVSCLNLCRTLFYTHRSLLKESSPLLFYSLRSIPRRAFRDKTVPETLWCTRGEEGKTERPVQRRHFRLEEKLASAGATASEAKGPPNSRLKRSNTKHQNYCGSSLQRGTLSIFVFLKICFLTFHQSYMSNKVKLFRATTGLNL